MGDEALVLGRVPELIGLLAMPYRLRAVGDYGKAQWLSPIDPVWAAWAMSRGTCLEIITYGPEGIDAWTVSGQEGLADTAARIKKNIAAEAL